MRKTGFSIFLSLLLAVSLHSTCRAESYKAVKGPAGGAPETVIVEQPQDSLRHWGGLKGKTLLLISEGLGISPLSKPRAGTAVKMLKDKDFDDLLQPAYPVAADRPVNGQNFLSLAARAGIITKIYWVPPVKGPVGKEPLEKFKEFLTGMGVSKKEASTLRQTPKSIRGKVGGVPVHICSLKDLPELKENVVILVDVSYFTALYENEVKTPFLGVFGGFMDEIGGKGLRASSVVISYSSGNVPLSFRFVGGYLGTYFKEPSRLKAGPPPTWSLRAQAMYYETFFQTEDMAEYYVEAAKLDPEDASIRYALAKTFFALKDLDGVRGELAEAVSNDGGYYPEYLDMGKYFKDNNMPEDALYFLEEARRINPKDPRPLEALHEIHFKKKDYLKAAAVLEEEIKLGFDNQFMLASLADTYLKMGDLARAEDFYKQALAKVPAVDRAARMPFVYGLAQTYEEAGKIQEAIDYYTEAVDSAEKEEDRIHIYDKIMRLKEEWAPFLNPPS